MPTEVRDLSFDTETRKSAIASVLADPHEYTVSDLAWLKEHYGTTLEQVWARAMSFGRAAGVFLDGKAIYVFGIDDQSKINTLSAASLENHKLGMTKALLRFLGTERGKEFFRGAIGVAEASDSTPQLEAWAAKLGFTKYAEVGHNGQSFNLFHKGA